MRPLAAKLLSKSNLDLLNISIEGDNIMTKYVLRWRTTPSRYFTCIWNKVWTKVRWETKLQSFKYEKIMTQGHIIISLAFLDGHSGEIYSELTFAMSHFCEKGRDGVGGRC